MKTINCRIIQKSCGIKNKEFNKIHSKLRKPPEMF